MEAEKNVKSTQEQAVASWINYLNMIRIDRFMDALREEQNNLDSALDTINNTLLTIEKDIVNNGFGRGGRYGMHGFIAEVAECGVGNARASIEGKAPVYEWINDNGPEDLRRGAELIQQKFVQSGGHLSLQAIQKHLHHYPDFIENGGKYQIPSDHYERIKWLLSISENDANKMPTSTGDFSLKQWREVNEFFESDIVPIENLEPSILDYKSVQKDAYEKTLELEKHNLQLRNQERRVEAYNKSKPAIAEGAKTAIVSAGIEGSTTLCIGIARKIREGKRLKDFNKDDWLELAGDTGIGTLKGGIRGASIYLLTNYTATAAAVASSLTTASCCVAEQAHRFRKGELNEVEFIENSELLCLDAAISALSSLSGQVIIPIPVIGAVIGNAVGTMMYQFAKDTLSHREQTLIEKYLLSVRELETEMEYQYIAFIDGLSEEMRRYMGILDRAFAPDIHAAFDGSIEFARELGVPEDEILDSREKVLSYFLN